MNDYHAPPNYLWFSINILVNAKIVYEKACMSMMFISLCMQKIIKDFILFYNLV